MSVLSTQTYAELAPLLYDSLQSQSSPSLIERLYTFCSTNPTSQCKDNAGKYEPSRSHSTPAPVRKFTLSFPPLNSSSYKDEDPPQSPLASPLPSTPERVRTVTSLEWTSVYNASPELTVTAMDRREDCVEEEPETFEKEYHGIDVRDIWAGIVGSVVAPFNIEQPLTLSDLYSMQSLETTQSMENEQGIWALGKAGGHDLTVQLFDRSPSQRRHTFDSMLSLCRWGYSSTGNDLFFPPMSTRSMTCHW